MESLNSQAAEFFNVFARVEYALKASGYNFGDGPAEADWGRFSRAIEDFVENPVESGIQEAIEFILREPPKKQYIANGLIEWREVRPSTNSRSDELFQYIRRVRNNLFHGGKFNGHWFAPERSERLMTASLLILKAAVGAEPRVLEAYRG